MYELGSLSPPTPGPSGLQDFSHLSIPLPTTQLQPWLRPSPQGPQASTLLDALRASLGTSPEPH